MGLGAGVQGQQQWHNTYLSQSQGGSPCTGQLPSLGEGSLPNPPPASPLPATQARPPGASPRRRHLGSGG